MKIADRSFLVFFIIAGLYLLSTLLDFNAATFYLKPLLILPLIVATYVSSSFFNKIWLFWALTFSWVGDILLLLVFKDELFFIGGLVSFLIAHIFYIILFFKELKKAGAAFKAKQPGLLLIILFVIAFYAFLSPYLGTMQIPVAAYAGIISFMLYVAYLLYPYWKKPSSLLLFTGALAFVASDSLLAVNKFFTPLPNAGFLIMATYLYAQGALVWACLGKRKNPL